MESELSDDSGSGESSSGSESGDSGDSDTGLVEILSKRSIAGEDDLGEQSESGSGSGSGSGNESGEPWDDSSGFGFTKRTST